MRARPIPRNLLIHDVVYKANLQGGWGGETADPVAIQHVRIEPPRTVGRNLGRSNTQETVAHSLVMFMSPVHTNPFLSVKEGDFIEWKGSDYEVVGVEDYYEFKTLHHKEVLLR